LCVTASFADIGAPSPSFRPMSALPSKADIH
jgi:hypothetical protein